MRRLYVRPDRPAADAADEVEAFLADASPNAYEGRRPAARLAPIRRALGPALARPGPLRRDARATSSTTTLPNAYQYRDYVIRALNADVPYDQFVIEHIAGDLLADAAARTRPRGSTNRSSAPASGSSARGRTRRSTSARTRPTASTTGSTCCRKTFLGLTVACARCHDHKFDAISTNDYYALSGYLAELATSSQVRFESTGAQQGRSSPAGGSRRPLPEAVGNDARGADDRPVPQRHRRPDESSSSIVVDDRIGLIEDEYGQAGPSTGATPVATGDASAAWRTARPGSSSEPITGRRISDPGLERLGVLRGRSPGSGSALSDWLAAGGAAVADLRDRRQFESIAMACGARPGR